MHYLGELNGNLLPIPVLMEDNGTISALVPDDEEVVNEVNAVTKKIIRSVRPLFDYMKEHIFINGDVLSQEMVVSGDNKVLALCDLSDSENVVEIKTVARKNLFDYEGNALPALSAIRDE